jgi:hypothetical protein
MAAQRTLRQVFSLCTFLAANQLTYAAAGTVFAYQGKLASNGTPVNGPVDLQFELWTAATSGSMLATTAADGVPATNGLFNAPIDFGVQPFGDQDLWLAISVRHPAGSGSFTPLNSRQRLTPSPYALQTRGIHVDASANLGVGTTTPEGNLHVLRGSAGSVVAYGNSPLVVENSTECILSLLAPSGVARGILFGDPLNNVNAGIFYNSALSNGMEFRTNGNQTRMCLTSQGRLGIGTLGPVRALHLGNAFLANSEGMIRLDSRSGTDSAARTWDIGVPETDSDTSGAGYSFVIDDVFTTPTDFMIKFGSGNVGIGTVTPNEKLDVRGGSIAVSNAGGQTKVKLGIDGVGNGVVTTDIMVLNGGSDIAEPYDIAPAGNIEPKPGMVVSIDPDRVGKMRVSSEPYDRTVAGIVSGANGIKPGLTLVQKGTVADGEIPVASVGRVWCYADADAGGAIGAGDLLTTSKTPGHAMKVSDHASANGAILGKAMSRLPAGRGMVLVLVSLQ